MAEALMELIGVKVPPEMKDRIDELAETERRPLSMMTRVLLEEALAARSKKGKKQ